MTKRAEVDWVSVEVGLPHDGAAVVGAVTGRYPDGEEFWLVLPMHFRRTDFDETTGEEIGDVFVDPDRVVRKPYGGDTEEQVTHWAAYPHLPGMTVHQVLGDEVHDALAAARRG
jgi:hypothetical protein